MRLYAYVDKVNPKMMALIYKVVMSNHKYAKAIHKGDWERAIELAIMHIAKNFDMSKSTTDNVEEALNRYAKRTLKWISEVSSDELDLKPDFSTEYEPFISDDTDDYTELISKLADKDIHTCMMSLVYPCVVNMPMLMTGKGKLKMEIQFRELRLLYSYSILESCTKYIKRKYGKDVLAFREFIDLFATLRSFSRDKISKYLDDTLTYVGVNNGMMVVTRKENTHSKYLYRVNYKDVIPMLFSTIYAKEGVGYVELVNVRVYASLSGKLFSSVPELIKEIELELIFEAIQQKSLSIFTYSKGEYIYFSSTRDDVRDLEVVLLGQAFTIRLNQVSVVEHIR